MPAPSTTTMSPSVTPAVSAAWTAHAVGSTITAASSVMASGTGWSWLSWATMNVPHPPPVLQQKPVCRPGSTLPKAKRSHPPRSPLAQATHTGLMPRATQPRTGSSTTLRSSSVSATTSWPGTKGKLTIGSK